MLISAMPGLSSWAGARAEMDQWQLALGIGAVIAAAISWKVDRALLWISVLAANFIVTLSWAYAGLPYQPVFVGLCDVCVCLLIDRYAKEEYEEKLFLVMRVSVLVSTVEFAGATLFKVESHLVYAIMLECVNWLALALISGAGLHQGIGGHAGDDVSRRSHNVFHSIGSYLRSPRKTHSWLHR